MYAIRSYYGFHQQNFAGNPFESGFLSVVNLPPVENRAQPIQPIIEPTTGNLDYWLMSSTTLCMEAPIALLRFVNASTMLKLIKPPASAYSTVVRPSSLFQKASNVITSYSIHYTKLYEA